MKAESAKTVNEMAHKVGEEISKASENQATALSQLLRTADQIASVVEENTAIGRQLADEILDGKQYAEWDAQRKGASYKQKLKIAIDRLIPISIDLDDLLRRLKAEGYEIKRGKYISFRAPGQERFTCAKTLGEAYTEEAIAERIKGKVILKAPGVGDKLPDLAKLREEYSRLSEEKDRLYAEYGSLKKRMREYDAVKQNIDSILSPNRGQEQDKAL